MPTLNIKLVKQLYTITFIFLTLFVKAAINDFLPPSAGIAVSANSVCQNAIAPVVTFTGNGGTAPYTFTYSIGSGATQTITTTGLNSSVTIPVNTSLAGSFVYNLIGVHDATLPIQQINVSGSVSIIVNPQPDASINGTGSGSLFGGIPVFKICDNVVSIFTFINASSTTTTLNTNYTINWGDGSPNFTGTSWSSLTHTYQVGLWNMTYTIQSSNGCHITKPYIVFVGSNPAVSLGNPGNTNICNSSPLTFPITGTSNNPPGTTYTVTFNDGSSAQVFNHPPPPSVTHNFLISSCGVSSSSGTTTFQNSFSANIVASNPCGDSAVGVVPIYVSTPPIADFTIPANPSCVNSQVCFTNTSVGANENNGSATSCNTSPKIIWLISPAVGFSLSTGSLGNDSGFTDPNLWISGSNAICLNFSIPGTYTITLKTGNKCGFDTEIKTICIESPLSPQFTLNTISGCAPQIVTATNTTIIANSCIPPTYLWEVNYTAANCGSGATPPYFTNGTNQNSVNPSFNFTIAGSYAIKLTMTNSCGSFNHSEIVNIKKPPTATINAIANFCGAATISPTGVINACAPSGETLIYNWSFPGGTPSSASTAIPGNISYAAQGNYTVSLTVSNGCGTSTVATQTFSINTSPTITNSVLSQTICSGSQTTPITFTATETGTTYTWTATATAGVTGFTTSGSTPIIPVQTISTTNFTAGTVTYVVTPSVGGCTGTAVNYVVTVNPAPAFTAQPSGSTVCAGGAPDLLSVSISSTTGAPLYQWYSNAVNNTTSGTPINGATGSTYATTATSIGTLYYYCIITLSSGGCASLTSNTAAVTITPAIQITAQPAPSQNLCVAVTIATPLTVSFTGGTGTTTYQWFSNTTNSTTGGTPISGATAANYTPSVYTNAGTYYYYATVSLNGTGCGAVTTSVAEVVVFADPTIDLQPLVSQTLCQGATPTNLTVNASGGNGAITYQWYSNTANNTTTGTLIATATGSTLIPPTTAVGTVYYYCVINQTATAGCSVVSNTAQLIIIAAPNITTHPQSATICQGGTLSALSVTYANGTGTPTYQWYSNSSDSTVGGTPVTGETNPTFTPSAAAVGTLYYYCIITLPSSGGCSSITSQTANITITPGASITSQPLATQDLCVGGTTPVAFTVTYTGGTGAPSYQWYSNTTNSNVGGTPVPGATNANFTPAVFTTAGTYYFYVVVTLSGNGCGPVASAVAEVIVTADPVVTTQPLASQSICQTVVPSALTVSATGGLGTFAYQWYSNTANNNTSGTPITGATTDTYTPPSTAVGTTYYYCVITQLIAIGCDVTSTTSAIIVNLAPTFTTQPISSIVCSGSTPTQLSVAYANGVGMPQYQWYSNTTSTTVGGTAIPGATNATYDPSATTVGTTYYYCIVTLPTGGCSDITSDIAEVSINANPIIAAKTATICSGTAFNIIPNNATGDLVPPGTTYSWSNPTINPTGAITGTSAETLQTGISQTLTNTTTSPATATYTVTPIAGSCPGVPFTVIITVNPSVSSNVTLIDITCFGYNDGSIQTNITGGIPFTSGPPYLIAWTGPNGFTSSAPTISALDPGVYNLTIDDAGGCPLAESYTIVEPADIAIATNLEKDVTCFGDADGEINITVAGGTGSYIYVWTKDTFPFAATEDIGSLAPGVYVVSVTDTNNCGPKTATFTITEPPLLTVSLQNQTNVLCFGYATGAINVTIAGGTMIEVTPGVFDYQYAWSGPNGFTANTQNLNNIVAGVYNLTVTENAGCVQILSVTITQPNEILVAIATTAITCYGANNASITLTVSGGVGPFQAAWDNLATGFFQNNLSAGTYVITITDATNCQKIITVNIPEAPIFVVNPIVTNISCFGANDGSINLNFVGGIAPVNLTWSDGSTAGTIRNNLAAGTYSVTIIDGVPCTIVRTFTIVEPQPIVLTGNLTDALDCNNANTGAINLLVAGGTPPFAYSWSSGATTEDLINISAGNYSITVTDARGCVKTAQYSIISPPPIVISVNTDTDFNCETHYVSQNFVAQVSGGIPPFQLQWSSGTVSGINNEIMHTETNGTVMLTVTDSNLCVATYPVIVDTPELGFNSFETDSNAYSTYGIYSVVDPIQFNSIVTGDYISISWNFGDGTFSTDLNPVHAYVNPSNYVVTQTVTYPFGCVYIQTITLKIEKGYFLVVPTAFTPNKDGINETLRPVFKGLTSIRLEIYDTWGSLIYSEEGASLKGWDGTLKGANAENGNYYCKVQAHTFYNQIVNENHPFILIK